jgi:hypothetical protein
MWGTCLSEAGVDQLEPCDRDLDVEAEQSESAEDSGHQPAWVRGRKDLKPLQGPIETHEPEENERGNPARPDAEREEQKGHGLPKEDTRAARAQGECVSFDREAALGQLVASAVVADEIEGV